MFEKEVNPEGIEKADLVVCIPSYNEADSISFPVQQASDGLVRYFPQMRSVIINTDNRLMSRTTLTKEFLLAVENYGLTLRDMERLALNAMKSAFFKFPARLDIIYNVVKPGYAKLRKSVQNTG